MKVQYLENNTIFLESINNQKNIPILKNLAIKYYLTKEENIFLRLNDLIKNIVEVEIIIIDNYLQ